MQTNDYKQIIDNADRLRTTTNTAGWQDILKIKNDKKAYYTQQALIEKDLNKIYYAQACVEVIDIVFDEVESLIKQGEEAGEIKKKGK